MKLKSLAIVFGVILASFQLQAQKTNVIFFAEGTEKFVLHVNGVRQNATAESNVKVEGLEASSVQVLIVFDTAIPQIKKLLALEPGREMTFAIKKNNTGSYVLRMISSVALASSSTGMTGDATKEMKPAASKGDPVPQSQVSSTAVSTTSVSAPDGTSVKVNVGGADPSTAASINIQVSGINTSMQVQSTTATTTAQSSPSNVYNEPSKNPEPVKKSTTCSSSMPAADFERAKKSIEAKSFVEEQMTICNQVIKVNCLSVKQVISIMDIFTYEENKVSIAKMAYPKTVDKNNYYQVNDAFAYSASVEELGKFIEQQ